MRHIRTMRRNAQVERRAATDVAEQEAAYRRARSNARLGHILRHEPTSERHAAETLVPAPRGNPRAQIHRPRTHIATPSSIQPFAFISSTMVRSVVNL